jgi:hypothetical protein
MLAWMWLGFVVFASAVVVTLISARRGSWGVAALLVAMLNLLITGMNSSAPFRGLLDPDYVGYRFGMIVARDPMPVFVLAGTVMLAAAAAAIVAASNRFGRLMFIVATIDGLILANMVGGFMAAARAGIYDFEIQFGEYLTIPSNIGLLVVVSVLGGPLIAATFWSLRRALPRVA